MQAFIRGCINQFQYAPAGVQPWATGSGPADPAQLRLAVALIANSGGDVEVNGAPQSLPYAVQYGDSVAGLVRSGGMKFSAQPGDAASGIRALAGDQIDFALAVSGSSPATVTVTDLFDPDVNGVAGTNLSIAATQDGFVSAVLVFSVGEAGFQP